MRIEELLILIFLLIRR